MITKNPEQPYIFTLNIENNMLKIHAKDRKTKDAFFVEVGVERLRVMGFNQSLKGLKLHIFFVS